MTRRQQCEKLYNEAFGCDKEFDSLLFDLFFDCVETLEVDNTVVAMYFKIPCILNLNGVKSNAYYIYAVTTHGDYRHKGIMTKLFNATQKETDAFYFLKPSSEGVINFYKQVGFIQIIGTRNDCDATIEVDNNFKKISSLCEKVKDSYPLMTKGNGNIKILNFQYTLE